MVFSLNEDAETLSGISREAALRAVDEVNLYHRIGEAALREIAQAFYDRVYADKHELSTTQETIRGVFANTTKADAVDSHFRFLVERLGGPALYTASKGPVQLIGRHAPYAGVNEESAERWLFHMTSQGSHAGITGLSRAKLSTLAQEAALRSVSAVDDDSRHRLMQFFRFHAFYIVLGRQLCNGTRLVGYGQAVAHPAPVADARETGSGRGDDSEKLPPSASSGSGGAVGAAEPPARANRVAASAQSPPPHPKTGSASPLPELAPAALLGLCPAAAMLLLRRR